MIMLQRVLLSCAVIAAWPASSVAQTGFADLVDHIHLAAPDQVKAVEWYGTHFGAHADTGRPRPGHAGRDASKYSEERRAEAESGQRARLDRVLGVRPRRRPSSDCSRPG